MITAEQFAKMIDGREYGDEIHRDEGQMANASKLVVVFGYSDDNMEFRGAIYDEVSCYDGGTAFVDSSGLITNKCDCDDCPYHDRETKNAHKIIAVWNSEGYSWIYQTDIPHATFNIMDDGERFCRGIVFSLLDVMTKPAV